MMEMIKKFIIPILIGIIFVVLAIISPNTAERSTMVTWDYFKEMVLIMPPVFLLMGLMEVWVPKNKIQKWFRRARRFNFTGTWNIANRPALYCVSNDCIFIAKGS